MKEFKLVIDDVIEHYANHTFVFMDWNDENSYCINSIPLSSNKTLRNYFFTLMEKYPNLILGWEQCNCSNKPDLHIKFTRTMSL